jgi:hypothetical protein
MNFEGLSPAIRGGLIRNSIIRQNEASRLTMSFKALLSKSLHKRCCERYLRGVSGSDCQIELKKIGSSAFRDFRE